MKIKSFLSILLALAIIYGIFAAMPAAAQADDPEQADGLDRVDYTAPSVRGPYEITLVPGYEAAETEPFVITGYPAPTVWYDSGYTHGGKVIWDDAAKTIKIEPGLEKGTYLFQATVYNAAGSTVFNFRITVTYKKPPPPDVGAMENFTKKAAYTPGMFADIDENAWYGFYDSKAVAGAYEYGLMRGGSGGTFNPEGNITIAEAVTVAARVQSIYMTGGESFATGSPWYQAYVDYAIDNGIIAPDDFSDYNRAATRAEMAYIFNCALPDVRYGPRVAYNEPLPKPPDVDEYMPYGSDIIRLYNAGIVVGSDDAHTFHPLDSITRAEASAILARLVDESRRFGSIFMSS